VNKQILNCVITTEKLRFLFSGFTLHLLIGWGLFFYAVFSKKIFAVVNLLLKILTHKGI